MVTHFAQLQKHLQFSKAVFLGSASGSDVMKARALLFSFFWQDTPILGRALS